MSNNALSAGLCCTMSVFSRLKIKRHAFSLLLNIFQTFSSYFVWNYCFSTSSLLWNNKINNTWIIFDTDIWHSFFLQFVYHMGNLGNILRLLYLYLSISQNMNNHTIQWSFSKTFYLCNAVPSVYWRHHKQYKVLFLRKPWKSTIKVFINTFQNPREHNV